jgi:hypothetical protein
MIYIYITDDITASHNNLHYILHDGPQNKLKYYMPALENKNEK